MADPRRFSCTFSGHCEPDPYGIDDQNTCQETCTARDDKETLYLTYSYLPEEALSLAPSDQVDLVRRISGTTLTTSEARKYLINEVYKERTLNQGPEFVYEFSPLRELRAVQVATGASHTVILTTDNQLYGIGSRSGMQFGPLGREDSRYFETPTLLLEPPGLVHEVVTHKYTTALVMDTGEVYHLNVYDTPAVDFLVDSMMYGEQHTIYLTLEGEVFVQKRGTTHRLEFREPIDSVMAGYNNSAVLTESGTLYAWGEGRHGELGNGVQVYDTEFPTLFPLDEPIASASLGGPYTAVITVSGKLYTVGNGSEGRLGTGGDEASLYFYHTLSPTLVNLPRPAVAVSAALFHCLVLLDDGTVFGFGSNLHGQLGFPKTTSRYPLPIQIRLPLPAVQISTGSWHCAVILEGGYVITFGSDENHQLGHAI
jgi:alpha-tubulin suppressor-like RCC1 family protein